MLPFVFVVVAMIGVSFYLGMIVGSDRKDRELRVIIDAILRRRFILDGPDSGIDSSEAHSCEFMFLRNGKTVEPLLSVRRPAQKQVAELIKEKSNAEEVTEPEIDPVLARFVDSLDRIRF